MVGQLFLVCLCRPRPARRRRCGAECDCTCEKGSSGLALHPSSPPYLARPEKEAALQHGRSELENESHLRVDDDRFEPDRFQAVQKLVHEIGSTVHAKPQLVLPEIEDTRLAHYGKRAGTEPQPGTTIEAETMFRFSRGGSQAESWLESGDHWNAADLDRDRDRAADGDVGEHAHTAGEDEPYWTRSPKPQVAREEIETVHIEPPGPQRDAAGQSRKRRLRRSKVVAHS